MAVDPRLFEALSAMQKCIRRSMERCAGYWAFWLVENNFAVAAFNRLRIVAYEDIGLADPTALLVATKAIDDGLAMARDRKGSYALCMSVAVLALCRAKKSREADHYQCVCNHQARIDPDRQPPDFALDKHTARGKRLGRGFAHFFSDGAKLVPQPEKDAYEDRAIQIWMSTETREEPEADNFLDQNDPSLFDACERGEE